MARCEFCEPPVRILCTKCAGVVARWPFWIVTWSPVVAWCEFCELALWRGGHFGSLRGPSLWRGANFVHAVGWRCDAVAILDRYVVLRCGVVPVLACKVCRGCGVLRLITDSLRSLARCWRSMLKL